MGNGRSRSKSDSDSQYLSIGQVYVERKEWIDNDTDSKSFKEAEEIIKRDFDSQKTSLDNKLVDMVSSTGVKVNPNATTELDYLGHTRTIRGYPTTASGVEKEDVQRARNVSLQYAFRILDTIDKLGFNLSKERLSINFSGTGPFFGVYTNRYKKRLDIIDGSLYIYGSTIFRKYEHLKNWAIAEEFNGVESFMPPIMAHELGHLFDSLLSKGKDTKFSYTINGSKAVSTYGNSSYSEAFAESFSMYVLGINSAGDSDYHKNFVKTMEDMGYSSLFGCAIKSSSSDNSVSKSSSVSKVAPTPKIVSTPRTVSAPPVKKSSTVRTASNFTKSSTSISGTIRGKKFTATITDGIRNKGYIERTVGSTKYRIDINTGAFIKID